VGGRSGEHGGGLAAVAPGRAPTSWRWGPPRIRMAPRVRVDSGCDVLVLGLLVGARLGDSTVELTGNPTPDQQRALDALLRTPSDPDSAAPE
jgi:hypothetical protein